jgi:hypothetical protein
MSSHSPLAKPWSQPGSGGPATMDPALPSSASPRHGLRLVQGAGPRAAGATSILRDTPDKYRLIDLRRRRAQIRARHALARP